AAVFAFVAAQAVRKRSRRRHARAAPARRGAAAGGGRGEDRRALAGIGPAAGADRAAPRVAVRRRRAALRRACPIIAARHAGPEHRRRDRRGAHAGLARRGRAARAAGAAALRAGARHGGGRGRDGGRGARRGGAAAAARRALDRGRGVRPLGDRGRAEDFDGMRWFRYASPQTFFPLAGTIGRVSAVLAALLALAGLYVGFFVAPTDAQQGEAYRIIFIHVPAA